MKNSIGPQKSLTQGKIPPKEHLTWRKLTAYCFQGTLILFWLPKSKKKIESFVRRDVLT